MKPFDYSHFIPTVLKFVIKWVHLAKSWRKHPIQVLMRRSCNAAQRITMKGCLKANDPDGCSINMKREGLFRVTKCRNKALPKEPNCLHTVVQMQTVIHETETVCTNYINLVWLLFEVSIGSGSNSSSLFEILCWAASLTASRKQSLSRSSMPAELWSSASCPVDC